jgi:hypothetical protein
MTGLEIWFDTDGLIATPPITVHLADDGAGTLRGTAAFVIHNAGTTPTTVTFDVLPDEHTPPSWFRVDQEQFTIPAGEFVRAAALLAVPRAGGFERHTFRGRVRSPGIAPGLSDPGGWVRPLPAGWALRSVPDTYLIVPRDGYEVTFIFHGPGSGRPLLFDIGAPDPQSAGWFSVDRPVQPDPGDPATLDDPLDFRWRVAVDVEAITASGRPGVWLNPFVSVEESVIVERDGVSYYDLGWTPYAHWFGYGVEVQG